jgi:hypothetical protein
VAPRNNDTFQQTNPKTMKSNPGRMLLAMAASLFGILPCVANPSSLPPALPVEVPPPDKAPATPAPGGVTAPPVPPTLTQDPFVRSGAVSEAVDPVALAEPPPAETPIIRLEVFSMPQREALGVMRKFPAQEALYTWLDSELEKQSSGIQLEQFAILRCMNGQKMKSEQITEFPYPTDFDPPQMALGAKAEKSQDWPMTAATPTVYQTRNLGWTSEIELQIEENRKSVGVSLALDSAILHRMENQTQSGDIKQPEFLTQQISSSIQTTLGVTTFLGTMNPVMEGLQVGKEVAPRTWLAFITISTP